MHLFLVQFPKSTYKELDLCAVQTKQATASNDQMILPPNMYTYCFACASPFSTYG